MNGFIYRSGFKFACPQIQYSLPGQITRGFGQADTVKQRRDQWHVIDLAARRVRAEVLFPVQDLYRHLHPFQRIIAAVPFQGHDLVGHFHAVDDCAEHGVLAVEEGGILDHDKEL